MISGANLLDYKERYSTKTYAKKRVLKTLVPYLIWSAISMIVFVLKDPVLRQNFSFLYVVNCLFTGDANPSYWFFPVLFILYLIIPIYANINKSTREKVCIWTIFIGFVITFLLPFIVSLTQNKLDWQWNFTMLIYPLVYACIGYLIKNYDLHFGLEIIVYVLGIAGFLTQLLGTQFLSIRDGQLNTIFKHYYNIPCFFQSLAVISIIKRIGFKMENRNGFVLATQSISKYTMTIYVSHYLIVIGLMMLFQNILNISTSSPLFVLVSPLMIVLPTILITWLLRKIPYIKIGLKYILP